MKHTAEFGFTTQLVWAVYYSCLVYLLSLGFTSRCKAASSTSPVPAEEVDALLEFKTKHMSKASQYQLQSWKGSNISSICVTWVGVRCTESGNIHIQDVTLPGFGLAGTLAPQLGNLSFLHTLDLSGNDFKGSIPWQLSGCTTLRVLDLSHNHLGGLIPAELGHLHSLWYVDLSQNNLTGTIPSSLSNCSNLGAFSVESNRLTGNIPAEFGMLGNLQHLLLSNNQLMGQLQFLEFSNMTNLFELELNANILSGAIPKRIGQLKSLKSLYLNGNYLTGEVPWETLSNCTLLSWIDVSNNRLSGGITRYLGDCVELTVLDLSQNLLSGGLPLQLGDGLPHLEVLDLSYNDLSGIIPPFLGTKMNQLRLLDVSFNNFHGPIPTQGVFQHLDASKFEGNPDLCGPIVQNNCSDFQQPMKISWKARLKIGDRKSIVLIASILTALLIGFVVIPLVAMSHYIKMLGRMVVLEEHISRLRLAGTRRYSAQDLIEATQGFSEVNLLGEGAFGSVYKGVLPDGKVVAVKKLKDVSNVSHEPQLLQEMRILGKLRHRNLLKVLGCVLNLDVKALVLEYMENGSLMEYLDKHHHRQQINEIRRIDSSECELDYESDYWGMLIRVAKGVAEALAYLHYENGVTIIHGDVKPSNILLDSDFMPHLGDFGLARPIEKGAGAGISLSSNFVGSIGYMAPEYAYATRITTKVDVYAYGVVLMEMLTGKKPTDVLPNGLTLHRWVKSSLSSCADSNSEGLEEVLDASLHHLLRRSSVEDMHMTTIQLRTYYEQLLIQLLQLGVACTEDRPNKRPTIEEVLKLLALVKE